MTARATPGVCLPATGLAEPRLLVACLSWLAAATLVVAAEPPQSTLADRHVHSLFRRDMSFTTESEMAFYVLQDDFPAENTIQVNTNEAPLVRGVDFVYDYRANTLQFTPPLPPGTDVQILYGRIDLGLDRVTTFDLFAVGPDEQVREAPSEPSRISMGRRPWDC